MSEVEELRLVWFGGELARPGNSRANEGMVVTIPCGCGREKGKMQSENQSEKGGITSAPRRRDVY